MNIEKDFSCQLILTKKERIRLFTQRALRYRIFVIIACSLLALGFILRICDICIDSEYANLRGFLHTAFPFLCIITSCLFLAFYTCLILCFIPKSDLEIVLTYDAHSNQLSFIQGDKKKIYLVTAVSIDCRSNVVFVSSGIRCIALPLQEMKLILPEMMKGQSIRKSRNQQGQSQ